MPLEPPFHPPSASDASFLCVNSSIEKQHGFAEEIPIVEASMLPMAGYTGSCCIQLMIEV